MKPIMEF